VHDVFGPDLHPEDSLSLVTCFQTIEHVPDPARLVRDAARMLKPGGILALVCHDRRAPVNRVLGLRSPIVDIEHLQLFSPASVTRLLEGAGLMEIGHRTIRNRDPLRYWARLLPLPTWSAELTERLLDRARVGDRPLSLPVGNLLAWGRRPSSASTVEDHASAV
jgi:SAM-dependent methyltransferase